MSRPVPKKARKKLRAQFLGKKLEPFLCHNKHFLQRSTGTYDPLSPGWCPTLISLAKDMAQPMCKVIRPGNTLHYYLKSTSVLICTCCSVDLDITVSDMTKVPDRGSDAVAGNHNLQNDCKDHFYGPATRSWCYARGLMKAVFAGVICQQLK